MSGHVIVQAHRGLSSEHPENTLAAFQAAAEAGFPVLEMDLRVTHDHEVIVLHDASIARTTDGSGRAADLDYDELREYDTGEGPVPRFEDVLTALDGFSGTWNVEMKDHDATGPALDLLDHHGLLDRTMVSSMDPRSLQYVADHHPKIQRGLITLGPPDQQDMDEASATGCTWINVDHDFIGEPVLAMAHAAGLRVGAWTVNDVDDARRLVDMGVASIITDERAVLEALGE